MNYLAESTAKLCQGGKGRYVDREGVPVDNCSREKCEPVIVFESLDLPCYLVDTLLMIGKIFKPWWLIIPFDVLIFRCRRFRLDCDELTI